MKPENRVKERRLALSLSARELGVRAGFGKDGGRSVRRIEARQVYPQILTRQRLAVALLTTVDDLFPRADAAR